MTCGGSAATTVWARKIATFAQLRAVDLGIYRAVGKESVALVKKLDLDWRLLCHEGLSYR